MLLNWIALYVQQKLIPLVQNFSSPVDLLSWRSKMSHLIIPSIWLYSPLRCLLLWFIIRFPLVWLPSVISVKNIGTLLRWDCPRSTHPKLSVEFPVQFQFPSSSSSLFVVQIFSTSSILSPRKLYGGRQVKTHKIRIKNWVIFGFNAWHPSLVLILTASF